MAVNIIEDIKGSHISPLVSAHNPIKIIFEETVDPDFAEITVGTDVYKISPDANGRYEFDLRAAVMALFPEIVDGFDHVSAANVDDPNLYVRAGVSINSIRTSGSPNNTVVPLGTWNFIHGIGKLLLTQRYAHEYRQGIFALSPVQKVWVFDGYPLDVTVFEETNTERIYLTDGSDFATVPNPAGTVPLKLTGSIAYERISNACGLYLKWLNSYGGWSYWLFDDKFITSMRTSRRQNYTRYFDTLGGSDTRSSSMGVDTQETITCATANLTDEQRDHLIDLLRSFRVYAALENNVGGTFYGKWTEVKIVAFDGLIKDESARSHSLRIQVAKPQNFSQAW